MPAPLTSFYPFVLPYAPSAPVPVVQRALMDACIELAREALVWREVRTIDVVAATPDYSITLPSGGRLTRVLNASLGDVPLGKVANDDINIGTVLTGVAVGAAQPARSTAVKVFFQKDLNTPTITLWPTPAESVTGGLVVKVAFEPLPSVSPSTQVPDVFYDQFAEVVAHGALHRLLRSAGETYTNIPESDRRGALFAAAIRNASVTARTGQITASSSVRPRSFA